MLDYLQPTNIWSLLTSPVVNVSFGLTEMPDGNEMKARLVGTAGTSSGTVPVLQTEEEKSFVTSVCGKCDFHSPRNRDTANYIY
jgi:hypothetical protein